jgi:hypothetical protein
MNVLSKLKMHTINPNYMKIQNNPKKFQNVLVNNTKKKQTLHLK